MSYYYSMSYKYPLHYNMTDNGLEIAIDEVLDAHSSNPVANWLLKKAIDEGGGGGGGGKGIDHISKTGTSGLVDTYTIYYTDGTTDTYQITNGANGAKGDKGDTGATGAKGDKGDKGNKGDKGDTGAAGADGADGAKGDKGDKGDPGENGAKGDPGENGQDGEDGVGITSITKTGTSGLVDTYTITYTDGNTSTFTVKNGEDGADGAKGDKGDPGADGAKGEKGDPGQDGQDGAKGDKGDPGEDGAKGDKGDPGKGAPIGSIFTYGSDTLPEGYLLCDGSAVSRTTYSELFTVIGTTFGTGDGSTTFNLPNLKGKVAVGNYNSSWATYAQELGVTGGEETHTLTVQEMPRHRHSYNDYYVGAWTDQSNRMCVAYADIGNDDSGGTNYTGGNQAHNNLQPYISLNYIIKAKDQAAVIAEVVNATSTSTTDVYSAKQVNTLLSSLTFPKVVLLGKLAAGSNITQRSHISVNTSGHTTYDTDYITINSSGQIVPKVAGYYFIRTRTRFSDDSANNFNFSYDITTDGSDGDGGTWHSKSYSRYSAQSSGVFKLTTSSKVWVKIYLDTSVAQGHNGGDIEMVFLHA